MKSFQRIFFLSLIITYLLPQSLSAREEKVATKDISVTGQTDQNVITIGDNLTYTISVEASPEFDFNFPLFEKNLSGLTIKDFGKSEKKKIKGKILQKCWYVLNTFETGSYIIPPAKFEYWKTNHETNKKIVFTAPLFIEVQSVLDSENPKDIKDIKDPVTITLSYRKYYFWAGIIVLALSLILACLLWFWKQKKKQQSQAITKKIPAHEIAYAALEKILNQNLIQQKKIKEYYFLISNVLRKYIEQRFSIMALEETTEEFLQELSQKKGLLAEKHNSILKNFLYHCDLVKFAKYGPTKEEIEDLYQTTKMFVDETKELETEPTEEENI